MGFVDEVVMEKPREKLDDHSARAENDSAVSKKYLTYAHAVTSTSHLQVDVKSTNNSKTKKKSSDSTAVFLSNRHAKSTSDDDEIIIKNMRGEDKEDIIMAAVEA